MENQVQGNKPLYTPADFLLVAKQLEDQYGVKQDRIIHQKDGSITAAFMDKQGHDKEIHFTPKAIHKKAEEIRISQAHATRHAGEEKHELSQEVINLMLEKYRRENSGKLVKAYTNKKGGLNIHIYLDNGQKIIGLSYRDVQRMSEEQLKSRPAPVQNHFKHLLK